MTTILILISIICGLMWMFGAGKLALYIMLVSIIGCFGYRLWFTGEEWESVAANAMFCILLVPIGWFGAKQFIKIESSISDKRPEKNGDAEA